MARTSTYLNFPRITEEAFLFYRSVFGGEFIGRSLALARSQPSRALRPAPRLTAT
jgi:PhnB protein